MMCFEDSVSMNGAKFNQQNLIVLLNLFFYEAFLAKEDAIRREDYLKTTKGKSTLRMMLRVSMPTVNESLDISRRNNGITRTHQNPIRVPASKTRR